MADRKTRRKARRSRPSALATLWVIAPPCGDRTGEPRARLPRVGGRRCSIEYCRAEQAAAAAGKTRGNTSAARGGALRVAPGEYRFINVNLDSSNRRARRPKQPRLGSRAG